MAPDATTQGEELIASPSTGEPAYIPPTPEPLPKGYSKLDAYNASVRPTGGYLALGFLLLMPIGVLVAAAIWPASQILEVFKVIWAAGSPVAGGLVMYFFKSREAEKAQAGNGGAQ